MKSRACVEGVFWRGLGNVGDVATGKWAMLPSRFGDLQAQCRRYPPETSVGITRTAGVTASGFGAAAGVTVQ